MSNFFQDVMGNLDDVQQKLLGPDYKYFKQINVTGVRVSNTASTFATATIVPPSFNKYLGLPVSTPTATPTPSPTATPTPTPQ